MEEISQLGGGGGHSIVFMQRYMDILQEWATAFDAFLSSHQGSLSEAERRAAQVLQLHRLLNFASLRTSLRRPDVDDQLSWDDSTEAFDEIVTLAESISSCGNSNATPRTPSFTLDVGIVGPLYEISRKCRDPVVRRKAIAVLCDFPRREGLWDGMLAGKVAERIVAIEEEGIDVRSCHDVPDWRRISNVTPIFDIEGKKCFLCYERKESISSISPVKMQETLVW